MGQAQAVATNLKEQRQLFSNIGDQLLSVAAKYPAVNGLLNAIRRKKSKVGRELHRKSAHTMLLRVLDAAPRCICRCAG